jgi:LysR family glycine cleavage system transcriptional activator
VRERGPVDNSQFNDIGLMCDGAAAGMGIALVRLGSGTAFGISVPSPHAHYLCWRTGTMERWECVAFAEWLQKSLG